MSILEISRVMPHSAVLRNNNNELSFKIGDIVNGIVTAKDKKGVTVRFSSNDELYIQHSEVTADLDVADEVSFEVKSIESDTVKLERVANESLLSNDNKIDMFFAAQIDKKTATHINVSDRRIVPSRDDLAKQMEEAAKLKEAVGRIARMVAEGAINMRSSVVSALIDNGVSLSEMSVALLNSVVARITEVDPGTAVDKNALEKSLNDRLSRLADMTDSEIAQIISMDKPLSIDNMIKGKYGAVEREPNVDNGQFELIKEDVSKLIENEPPKTREKYMQAARFLYSRDLPVTLDNMKKTVFLKGLSKSDVEDASQYAADGAGLNADIIGFKDEQAHTAEIDAKTERFIRDFRRFNAENVRRVVSTGLPLTLFNLRNTAEATETGGADLDSVPAVLEGRRALIQIQLKMTYEAVFRLHKSDLNIDTKPLEDVLAALEQAESDINAQNAVVGASAVTSDSAVISETVGVMASVYAMYPLAYGVYRELTADSAQVTIERINDINRRWTQTPDYDAHSARARQKYGDSADKLDGQFERLLEQLGLPATRANVFAAKALSKCQAEVNEENILNVKLLDAKITEVYQKLTPAAAAHMIQSGKNPLKMTLDEILEYVEDFRNVFGDTKETEDVARAIYEMDKKGLFKGADRDGVIAFYRLINKIDKNPYALSAVVESGKAVTLENLLQMAEMKTFSGVSRVIDDNNGFVERNKRYAERIFNRIKNSVNAFSTSEAVKNGADGKDIEELLTALEMANEAHDAAVRQNLYERACGQVRDYARMPAEVIEFAVVNNIPVTLANLSAIKRFIGEDDFFENDAELSADELPDNVELAKEEGIGALFDAIIGDTESAGIKKVLDIQRTLYNAGRPFMLPVAFEGGVKTVRLYMTSASGGDPLSGETPVAYMSVNTREFGRLGVHMEMSAGAEELGNIRFEPEKNGGKDLNDGGFYEYLSKKDIKNVPIESDVKIPDAFNAIVSAVIGYISEIR